MSNFVYTGKSLHSPSPAVESLIRVMKTIPVLQGYYTLKKGGKSLPRLQWRANGGLNRHDAGVALDIILFSKNSAEKNLAYQLADLFVGNKYEMGWSSFIYMDQIWEKTKTDPSSYTKDERHFDHIHIDWLDWNAYLDTGKKGIPWVGMANAAGSEGGLLMGVIDNELNRITSF